MFPARRLRVVVAVLVAAVVLTASPVGVQSAGADTGDDPAAVASSGSTPSDAADAGPDGSSPEPTDAASAPPADPGAGAPDDGSGGAPSDAPTVTASPTEPASPGPADNPTASPSPSAAPEPAPTLAAPDGLHVGADTAPLAVDPASPPVLSWVPAAASDGTAPSSFRVVVASSVAGAAAGRGDVWDSGVRAGTGPTLRYAGPTLAAASRYWFSVQTALADGTVSPWATPTTFGTVLRAWNASPIWAQTPATTWTDVTVSGTVTVDRVALGVSFRATDGGNGYMWQFRRDGRLVPHVQRAGRYTVLPAVDLGPSAASLRSGRPVPFSITVTGDRIVTTVNGVVVDDRRDGTWSRGWVGVRTGGAEGGRIAGLQVTAADGHTLWAASGSPARPDLTCTTLRAGTTSVGAGRSCVHDPWAAVTVDETFVATTQPTAVVFRASDDQDGYMWQFDPRTNSLVPHVQVHGVYRKLPAVPLGVRLVAGRSYSVRIETSGPTIATSIGGRRIDVRSDRTFSRGLIGFRTGGNEQVTATSLRVTSRSGATVYAADRNRDDFSCATLTGTGAEQVPRNSRCLVWSRTPDWAFARTTFDLPSGDVAWATAWSTGTSPEPARQFVYRLAVNGTFAAAGPVRSVGSETRYDTTDVTASIRPGRNAVGVQAYTEADHRLLVQIVVQYTDGRRVTVGTGPGWRTTDGTRAERAGPSVGTGYYRAPSENVDAAAFPSGYSTTAFVAAGWTAPALRPAFATGALQASPVAPLDETVHAVSKTLSSSGGHLVLDFGRTWMGGIRLRATAAAATEVTVHYGETTTSGGRSLPATTTAGNTWTDHWRLRRGTQTVDVWGLRVFRYVELSGLPAGVTAADVQAVALHSPIGASASFDSSDATLDAVRDLSARTIEGNTLGLYTDSWERERAPYEADAYVQQLAQAALTTDSTSAAYTTRWLLAKPTWPTEWRLYDALAVHDRWMETGDTGEVLATWSSLQRTLLTGSIDPGTGLVRRADPSNDIVDWPGSARDGYVFTPTNTVVNALTYRDLVVMSEMAGAIGHRSEADSYAASATRLRSAMNARLWDPARHAYRDGLTASGAPVGHWAVQASTFALAFGVPTDRERAGTASSVAARGMACSVYCAAFLVPALLENGQATAGRRLLTGTGTSSWVNMIRAGAGSTMEAWDVGQKANTTYSHPWAASPASTVVTSLVGVRPTAPGWSAFTVAPATGGLGWATVARPSPRGTIRAGVVTVGTTVDVAIAVPSTSTATVVVPGAHGTVWVDGAARNDVQVSGTTTSVVVAAGCHTVSATSAASAASRPQLRSVCAAG